MVRPPRFERGTFSSGGEFRPDSARPDPSRPNQVNGFDHRLLAWLGSLRAQFTDRTFSSDGGLQAATFLTATVNLLFAALPQNGMSWTSAWVLVLGRSSMRPCSK